MKIKNFTRSVLFQSVRSLFSCCVMFLFLSIAFKASAGQMMTPMKPHALDLKSNLNRVIELHLEGSETLARSSALLESLDRTLTALQPSLMMVFPGSINDTVFTARQAMLFLEIQKKILATNPHCKFSVSISINNYLAPSELLTKLQEVTTKFKPDVINLVLSSNNELVSPTVLARAIEYAHAHGQVVTYEGPATMIPDAIDGFVMKALNGEIKSDDVNNFKNKHHLPVIVQCSSLTHDQDRKEILLLTRLAEGQSALGYHLAYPLLLTSSGKLSENKDASFLVALRALMTRYN